MRKQVEDFKRIELFNHYNEETNPFLYVTTKIDITNIYKKCKHYYPTIAFFLHQAIEKVDNLKYRFEDNKIYHYDSLRINFTERKNDGNIGYFTINNNENYNEFMKEYLDKREKLLNSDMLDISDDHGEIWYSCNPWFHMTQVVSPFNKSVTIPQFIWDKFSFEDDNVYVNLTIMVHHGFCDAFHLNEFLKYFEDIEKNIDVYL